MAQRDQRRRVCAARLGYGKRSVGPAKALNPILSFRSGRALNRGASKLNSYTMFSEGDAMNVNRTALITGASRGLGLAPARWPDHGWNLIIEVRGEGTLRRAANELAALTPHAVIAIVSETSEVLR
jgi:hypothetical protein